MRNFKIYILAIVLWSILLAGSLSWNILILNEHRDETAINVAKAFFQEVVITRKWNASHGGVYVKVDSLTQPNPYLQVPLRDIQTDSIKLTLINPAYMTRQISEMARKENNISYHLTSLKPLRPDNKPDKWEEIALQKFERGEKDVVEIISNDSGKYLRYMQPLLVEKSCLKCHEKQGYKLNDVRGGISITIPNQVYYQAVTKEIIFSIVVHLIVFILGIIAMVSFKRYYIRQIMIFKNKNKELEAFDIFSSKLNDNLIATMAEMEQKEEDLKRMSEELKELNATKDKFFSIIAHDLKNPFNAIIGFSEMLEKHISSYDQDKALKFAHIINTSAFAGFKLLENLLEWSRAQTGIIKYEPQKLLIKEIVDEEVKLIEAGLLKKDITFIDDFQLDIFVFVDRSMIRTVIRNLLSNAIKYTPDGGTIIVSVAKMDDDISAKKQSENFLVVSIIDSGVGIREEDIKKLFRIDTSFSTECTANETGTGLGLLLCKEFVNRNKGDIWVESELGKGSIFKFTLPIMR